ncbi:uncharacterized protein LOC111305186 [Durio zibethinus]|uniref:Uncharacterized protein LOC111305186 n=1 Tax=Durio zibethinus TaxID=66656 RepID=A0A6P6A0E1_DURZI|nr:uncharacterized protein LOC111305186 [Durio zibethinus]
MEPDHPLILSSQILTTPTRRAAEIRPISQSLPQASQWCVLRNQCKTNCQMTKIHFPKTRKSYTPVLSPGPPPPPPPSLPATMNERSAMSFRDGETVAVDADSTDSRRAVDVGRDTYLGFSEVEVKMDRMKRIEVNSNPGSTFRRESEEIRVSNRGFSPKGKLSTESPSKRLQSLDFESRSAVLGTPKEKYRRIIEIFENVSPSPGASSELELENQQNHEFSFEVDEGIIRKRGLDFLTEVIDSEREERNMDSEKQQ